MSHGYVTQSVLVISQDHDLILRTENMVRPQLVIVKI